MLVHQRVKLTIQAPKVQFHRVKDEKRHKKADEESMMGHL